MLKCDNYKYLHHRKSCLFQFLLKGHWKHLIWITVLETGYCFCFAIEIDPSRRSSLDLIITKSHSKRIRKLSFVLLNRKRRHTTLNRGVCGEDSQLPLRVYWYLFFYKWWLKLHSETSGWPTRLIQPWQTSSALQTAGICQKQNHDLSWLCYWWDFNFWNPC